MSCSCSSGGTHGCESPHLWRSQSCLQHCQQKTVDTQDNGAELTWQTKFYEVQSHYTYTKHIYSPYLILMSKDKFDGLTPEQQEIVLKVSDEAVAYERQRCDEYEQTALDNIKNCGTMQYSDLTPEVKAEMVKACKNIKELAYKKVTDPSVVDLLYDEVAKAKEKFPKKAKKERGVKYYEMVFRPCGRIFHDSTDFRNEYYHFHSGCMSLCVPELSDMV